MDTLIRVPWHWLNCFDSKVCLLGFHQVRCVLWAYKKPRILWYENIDLIGARIVRLLCFWVGSAEHWVGALMKHQTLAIFSTRDSTGAKHIDTGLWFLRLTIALNAESVNLEAFLQRWLRRDLVRRSQECHQSLTCADTEGLLGR